jgi:hypothetical protein
VTALATVWWVVAATPSGADSAGPSNYRSEVTEVVPSTDRVVVTVIGGDSFLSVAARPEASVEVPGYQGEPYVRIDPNGDVLVNRNSPSFWLNQDRFAQVGIPESAAVDATPDWQRVSGSGAYGWHDHRIHWMSPEPPPAVDRSARSLVLEWTVPLVVDGEQVTVAGQLWCLPTVSPVPWVLAAVGLAAVVVWAQTATWGLAAGSAAALLVGLSQATASPLGLTAEAMAWVPPALALFLGLASIVVGGSNRMRLLALGGAVLSIWTGLRLASLWLPVLPSGLADTWERGFITMGLATAVAALIQVYRRLGRTGAARVS